MAGGGQTLETPNPGRWRLIAGFVVLMALAAFVVVMWFVFQEDQADGRIGSGTAIPVVRAPDGPDRQRPENPGGAEVPDRDKSVFETFNKVEDERTETVERLLPPPESALPETVPPARPEGDGQQVIDVAERPEPVPPPAETEAAVPAPAPAPVERAKPEPARTIADLVARTEPKAAEVPAPKVAAVAPSGEWQVQLAAFRDEPSANEAWDSLQKKFPDRLASLKPTIIRADLGDRGIYFRLRTGDFASKQEADTFCQALAAKGQGCISARR
ncbi:MAG: SPOR domain-containing protein [Minwuia sp.]|nr:SPOR domain-containing protein [Minwuia sp.]